MHGEVKNMPSCNCHASLLFSVVKTCGCCSTDSNEGGGGLDGGVTARGAYSNHINNSEKQRQ